MMQNQSGNGQWAPVFYEGSEYCTLDGEEKLNVIGLSIRNIHLNKKNFKLLSESRHESKPFHVNWNVTWFGNTPFF